MKRWARNIACALLVIFVFPIIYQPLHIMWHRANNVACCGCGKHIVCLHSSVGKSEPQINKGKYHCPVCEYDLVINSLPEYFTFDNFIPRLRAILKTVIPVKHIWLFVQTKLSRAPPAVVPLNIK